jgi:outer membrane protein assembly factor BamE (lipoprotein component of BamABCDE complex)
MKTKVFAFTSVLMAALAIFTFAGCASSGVQVSQEAALQFREQKSTENEIITKLGRPTMVTIEGDKKVLLYTGSQVRVKAVTFIPVVGTFAGGADIQTSSATYQINTQTGLLEKITYSTYGTTTQAGSQPAPSYESVPRYVQ